MTNEYTEMRIADNMMQIPIAMLPADSIDGRMTATPQVKEPYSVDPECRAGGYAILDCNGKVVATTTQRNPHPNPMHDQGISDEQSYAQATLMVAACNLHKELAEALRDLLWLDSNMPVTQRQGEEIRKQARAVLIKANAI